MVEIAEFSLPVPLFEGVHGASVAAAPGLLEKDDARAPVLAKYETTR
jgi:hypothetical protein